VIERWTLPDGRDMKIPGIVPKLTDTPGATRWLGPTLGEHTAEVLERLGYSVAEQASLRQRGVI
jgi:formyl-CoA transferase